MAPTPEPPVFAEGLKRCYYCGHESAYSKFKYYNNKKLNQPRLQCSNCKKYFTAGCHGRPQGTTYAKKRNQDPAELQGLPRDCCHCGVADNAPFKYYNNKSLSQPRFRCLSCGEQFQMRLVVDGHARHLVHTSTKQRQPRSAWKEPAPSSTSLDSADQMNWPCDGTPMPEDPCASTSESAPQMSDENVSLLNLMVPDMVDEVADFMNLIEAGCGDNMSESGSNVDGAEPLSSSEASVSDTANEAEALNVENDVDMVSYATNATLDVAQCEMQERIAPGTFIIGSIFTEADAKLLKSIETGVWDEPSEAEAVNDADRVSATTMANLEVLHDQMVESAPEIFPEDPFAEMGVPVSTPFSFQQALLEDEQRDGCEDEDMEMPFWS